MEVIPNDADEKEAELDTPPLVPVGKLRNL